MDLEFSEEQHLMRDMSRAMLAEHCPIEVVRRMEDDPKGYPDALWKQVCELGLAGMLIPEAYGGSAQSLLEAALVYEEFGRALAPTPHFVSCVLAARILLAAGSEEQKAAWVERIGKGEAIVTPAWLEPERGYGPAGVALEARAQGGDFSLTGTKRHVHFARAADRMIALARTQEGIDLFLIDPNAPGVTLTQQLSLGSDCQYRVDFSDVRGPIKALASRVDGLWSFTPVADGVRVTWQWTLHARSALVVPILPIFARLWRGYAQRALIRLDALLVSS